MSGANTDEIKDFSSKEMKLLKDLFWHFSEKEVQVPEMRKGYLQILAAYNTGLLAAIFLIFKLGGHDIFKIGGIEKVGAVQAGTVLLLAFFGLCLNWIWYRISRGFQLVSESRFTTLRALEKKVIRSEKGGDTESENRDGKDEFKVVEDFQFYRHDHETAFAGKRRDSNGKITITATLIGDYFGMSRLTKYISSLFIALYGMLFLTSFFVLLFVYLRPTNCQLL